MRTKTLPINANPWFVELLKGLYFRTGLHPIKHQEISRLARHGEHRLADLAVTAVVSVVSFHSTLPGGFFGVTAGAVLLS